MENHFIEVKAIQGDLITFSMADVVTIERHITPDLTVEGGAVTENGTVVTLKNSRMLHLEVSYSAFIAAWKTFQGITSIHVKTLNVEPTQPAVRHEEQR